MGVDWNGAGIAPPLVAILEQAKIKLNGRPVSKALIFAPDALGSHLLSVDPALFAPFEKHCPEAANLHAEMPSVTPVCFASIFSGLKPIDHGIREYAKPVLACDTLFDKLQRAGKRVAIVAVADSSIDKIFRNRAIDYFSEPYDSDVTERCLELLKKDSHDLILAYQQEYDDTLHDQTPFTADAIQAVRNHGQAFETLAAAAREKWRNHDLLLAVTPDHGAHIDDSGKGDHGLAIEADLQVRHFYGLYARDAKLDSDSR